MVDGIVLHGYLDRFFVGIDYPIAGRPKETCMDSIQTRKTILMKPTYIPSALLISSLIIIS